PLLLLLVPFAGGGNHLVGAFQKHHALDVLWAALERGHVLGRLYVPDLDRAISAGGGDELSVTANDQSINPVSMPLELLHGHVGHKRVFLGFLFDLNFLGLILFRFVLLCCVVLLGFLLFDIILLGGIFFPGVILFGFFLGGILLGFLSRGVEAIANEHRPND